MIRVPSAVEWGLREAILPGFEQELRRKASPLKVSVSLHQSAFSDRLVLFVLFAQGRDSIAGHVVEYLNNPRRDDGDAWQSAGIAFGRLWARIERAAEQARAYHYSNLWC